MKRMVMAALLASLLSACGSLVGSRQGSIPVPPSTAPVGTSTPSPSASPSSSTPSPAVQPPAAVATAAPPTPMLSRTLPLVPVGGSHVSGVVEISERSGTFLATVSARGLSTTLHTVHIHQGSCRNPYAGMHLTVLGLLGASAGGTGTLTAGLGSVYVSPGHYVIVYASTSPQVIIGCADLVSLG